MKIYNFRTIKKSLGIFALFSLFCATAFSEDQNGQIFKFKHKINDASKITCTVDEDVYMNRRFLNHSQIINRITSLVTEVDENGTGTLDANFMTSEVNTGASGRINNWGEEYHSIFKRSPDGKYDISNIYFMPTVRNVPVFPEYELKIGDTWQAEGHEAHDLRRSFNVKDPYKVPFTADYKYLRDELTDEGKKLNVIQSAYKISFTNPFEPADINTVLNVPYNTTGKSVQTIWWDNEKGMIDHYSEEFAIQIETYGGNLILFQGTSHAEVTEFQRENTQENLSRLTETVSDLGLEDVEVKQDERGLTISIENIQFLADSAILRESEKEKLSKIAAVLKSFSNDLLITGHCAKRGSVKMQQTLSEQRASAVAKFLEDLNIRSKDSIYVLGKGASDPIASNSTEAGRARNRRVEITIMDK